MAFATNSPGTGGFGPGLVNPEKGNAGFQGRGRGQSETLTTDTGYRREFADVWEFVEFAEQRLPDVDLKSPPKRP